MVRRLALALLPFVASFARPAQAPVSKEDAAKIAAEGFVYGYPLVLMDITRQKMTAVPSASAAGAPLNQFDHKQAFPDASFTDVVSPNADTLYSVAWLDLAQEPIVLSLPDTGERYYLMEILDGWTNVFASPGKRTTGTSKTDIALCGPNWKGTLPSGVKEQRAPTEMVWVIGRTQTNGARDFDSVHAIQAGYKLTPLSAWGKPYTPPANVPVDASVDKQTSPVEQVAKMDGVAFFTRLAALMKSNPPAAADSPMVGKLARIRCIPGQPFKPDAQSVEALNAGIKQANADLVAGGKKVAGGDAKGWHVNSGLGSYGTDYAKRAGVALFGLGANLDADALYPSSRTDADGVPFDGANRYVLHFDKGQTPPVNAFWSLTLYNDKQAFADNKLNRYAIGDRDALKANTDGSIDLYIQNESPGADKESNWLPAPKGSFNLVLRMYWPKDEAATGKYQVPPVKRVP